MDFRSCDIQFDIYTYYHDLHSYVNQISQLFLHLEHTVLLDNLKYICFDIWNIEEDG
jgi:hypothetical protein